MRPGEPTGREGGVTSGNDRQLSINQAISITDLQARATSLSVFQSVFHQPRHHGK